MRNHIKSYDGDGRYDEPLVLVMATVKMNANVNMFLGLGSEIGARFTLPGLGAVMRAAATDHCVIRKFVNNQAIVSLSQSMISCSLTG